MDLSIVNFQHLAHAALPWLARQGGTLIAFVDDTDGARRLAEVNADRMASARRRAGLGLPTPEDIAPLVLFLCGGGARRITGQVISVNGGVNA